MKSVAIIGAGITGLTAAFYLKRKGVPVIVYEAGGRAGGVIQSIRKDRFLAESGPNTILETSPKLSQLVRDLNLESRRLYTDQKANGRFGVRDRQPVLMPESVPGFFRSKVFSIKAKLAVLREPFVPPRRDGKEESIAEFVQRRLGQEFLDYAIDPMVAGVYAGDPWKLSVRHAFPKLARLEEKYGSLIRGRIFGARERSGEVAKNRAPKFSFDEGLQVLPDELARQSGDSLKLNSPVTKLAQIESGWRVTTTNDETDFGAVIYCGTAHRLAELNLEAKVPANLPVFSEISHPPVASVVLGFHRDDVTHPCQGFGMLIPKIEGFKILGTIFSSALFPNSAPADHVLLTSYVGGARYPGLGLLPEKELIETTLADLRALLGVKGKPVFTHTAVYPRAIPQYNVGYAKYRDLLNKIEHTSPNLFFAGHYRDGVSLGDSIVSGVNIAERVVKLF